MIFIISMPSPSSPFIIVIIIIIMIVIMIVIVITVTITITFILSRSQKWAVCPSLQLGVRYIHAYTGPRPNKTLAGCFQPGGSYRGAPGRIKSVRVIKTKNKKTKPKPTINNRADSSPWQPSGLFKVDPGL